MNVGHKSFGNCTSLSAEIASADDFENRYTYDAINRLTRLDQSPTVAASVAEKRVDFASNAIGQFTSIARFNDLRLFSDASIWKSKLVTRGVPNSV